MEELLEINKIVRFNSKSEILKYKYIEYVETLVYGGDELLELNDLPSNENKVLKTIKLLNNSLSSIKGTSIPQGVVEIYYPWENETVTINLLNLPSSVTSIYNYFITHSEILTSDKIPEHITCLSFTCYSGFNQTITNGLFHDNISLLNLGDDWNNGGVNISISNLPNSLQVFDIKGYKLKSFNEFPSSLTSLSIGHENNCIINSNDIISSLPNLKSLSVSSISNLGITITGNDWNGCNLQSLKLMSTDITIVENSIYNSTNLTNLEIYVNLAESENQTLKKQMIPNNLKSLIMKTQFNKIEKEALPSTLTSLTYNLQDGVINNINEIDIFQNTPNIKELSIDFKSNGNIEISKYLLSSITKLVLGSLIQTSSIQLNKLPQSILELEFIYSFNELLKINDLPIGLKKLTLSTMYNKPIENGVLPNTLEYLEFGSEFNNVLELPLNLKSLKFPTYGNFNQIFKSSQLPSSLTNLELNNNYSYPLTSNQLPSSLITLTIPKTILKQSSIPSSVKLLNLN